MRYVAYYQESTGIEKPAFIEYQVEILGFVYGRPTPRQGDFKPQNDIIAIVLREDHLLPVALSDLRIGQLDQEPSLERFARDPVGAS